MDKNSLDNDVRKIIDRLPARSIPASAITPADTDGKILVTDNRVAKWQDSGYIPESIGDAKGDLIGFSAADTPVRIAAASSNGSVLTADSTAQGGAAWRSPIQRMKVGSVIVANATGNQAVTGIGFRPALVKMTAVNNADTANPARGIGAMDSAGNQWTHTLNSAGTAHDRYRTNRCIYLITAAGVVAVEASYVSMDTDGFTINIVREDLGANATIILWEAYA